MHHAIELNEAQSQIEPPVAKLDEAVWQAWLAKGRVQNQRNFAARMLAVKWVAIIALLATAGLWFQLGPYGVVTRFVVTGAAAIVMFQALSARRYPVAAVFGALVLLYNPVSIVFSFSGDWQRALVMISALPFGLALMLRNRRLQGND